MYKMRMIGFQIHGPSYIYGDNILVIHITQQPESTLKKESNYICYHNVSEYVAIGESLNGHVDTNKNCADLDTKVHYGGKHNFDVSNLLYDVYNDL